MKKNVFEDWLREFCMLVFIQTVQSFIFAIVMSLIVSVMASDYLANSSNLENSDIASATGVIAIILLASVSKIEELVQKIFGIKSGVHDSSMRGGMKSLATTMMAANLAKGVLDNGKKVAGGLIGAGGAAFTARKEANQARARLARDLRGTGAETTAGAGGGNPPLPDPGNNTTPGPGGAGGGSNSGTGAGNSGSSNATTTNKDIRKAFNDYEDKIQEIKQKRNQNIRNSAITALSGLTETAGALGGAAVGMTAGAALGEGKEILQGGLAGLGLGDKAGSLAVKPIKMASDFGGFMSELSESDKQMIKQVSNMNAEARDAINERRTAITRAREARRQLDREIKNFDAGNID